MSICITRIIELADGYARANGIGTVERYRGKLVDEIEKDVRDARREFIQALEDALQAPMIDLLNQELLAAVRRLLNSDGVYPPDAEFAESVILRAVDAGVPDSNRGVSQGQVATGHESAPTRAHDGTAGGVSPQPSLEF